MNLRSRDKSIMLLSVTAKKKEATKHIGMRIPLQLHAELTMLAKRDHRSLSNLILVLMEQAVDKKR